MLKISCVLSYFWVIACNLLLLSIHARSWLSGLLVWIRTGGHWHLLLVHHDWLTYLLHGLSGLALKYRRSWLHLLNHYRLTCSHWLSWLSWLHHDRFSLLLILHHRLTWLSWLHHYGLLRVSNHGDLARLLLLLSLFLLHFIGVFLAYFLGGLFDTP